jgi:hypothetical protein
MAAVDASRCPLCGRPNACALAGRDDQRSCSDCWCAAVRIDPQVLERVPEAVRGKACLCRACATRSMDAPPAQSRERP